MIRFVKTPKDNPDFVNLVKQLDQYLATIDGEEHAFYKAFNKSVELDHIMVAYIEDNPVGCGALKHFDQDTLEVKRMFVIPSQRSKGIASQLLMELEAWARALSYKNCVLEVGKRQPDAVHLYQKNGYELIPNYGQYIGIANSLCLRKNL